MTNKVKCPNCHHEFDPKINRMQGLIDLIKKPIDMDIFDCLMKEPEKECKNEE